MKPYQNGSGSSRFVIHSFWSPHSLEADPPCSSPLCHPDLAPCHTEQTGLDSSLSYNKECQLQNSSVLTIVCEDIIRRHNSSGIAGSGPDDSHVLKWSFLPLDYNENLIFLQLSKAVFALQSYNNHNHVDMLIINKLLSAGDLKKKKKKEENKSYQGVIATTKFPTANTILKNKKWQWLYPMYMAAWLKGNRKKYTVIVNN